MTNSPGSFKARIVLSMLDYVKDELFLNIFCFQVFQLELFCHKVGFMAMSNRICKLTFFVFLASSSFLKKCVIMI